MSDFWDNFTGDFHGKEEDSVNSFLQGKSLGDGSFNSVYALTEKGRDEFGLQLPAEVGSRVAFITNVGSLLTYENPPLENTQGTVVMVRTAEGDTTSYSDHVFVKWDDGSFGPYHKHHLRSASHNAKFASSVTFRTASLGDLSDFFAPKGQLGEIKVQSRGQDLIHKSTHDLWSLQKQGEEFVISRLFDDTGEPLKFG